MYSRDSHSKMDWAYTKRPRHWHIIYVLVREPVSSPVGVEPEVYWQRGDAQTAWEEVLRQSGPAYGGPVPCYASDCPSRPDDRRPWTTVVERVVYDGVEMCTYAR